MEYDREVIEGLIDRAVADHDDCEPAFYAVTGSHCYGFASESRSDVDVRGFHLADWRRYALLDRPDEQFVVNQDGVTPGYEEYEHVDLVSYELRKFGQLVHAANFNVLETLCCGDELVNEMPEAVRALRSLVADHLPLDVPTAYVGMATNNYRTYLDPERDSYDPTAKNFLYVLRALLAARYVLDEERIEADVTVLADEVLGETDLVDELIAVRRDDGAAAVPDELAARADERIVALLDDIDPPERAEKTEFRDAIDDWMLRVRE